MSCRGTRVVASVLLGALGWAIGVVAPPGASASWCTAPSQLGNVDVNAGVTAVAVSQTNVGNPNSHSVYVCNDPAGSAAVSLTNADPARTGQQVSVASCPLFLGCTTVTKTGVEVGTPTTTVDAPNDGNNRVATSVGTGSGVCLWMGMESCQLGGGSYGFSQPLREPVPSSGDVAYVTDAIAGLPNRCMTYVLFAGLEAGALLCTWDAQGVPGGVLWALTT